MADQVGDTRRTASRIELSRSFQNFTDRVSQRDQDFYKFQVERRSFFQAFLTGVSQTTNFVLFDKDGNVVNRAKATRDTTGASIQEKGLNKGTYFLKVSSDSTKDMLYRFSAVLVGLQTYTDPEVPGSRRDDRAGNTRKSARQIFVRSFFQTYSDFVGDNDRVDLYGFTAEKRSLIQVYLADLRANANVALLDAKGNVLARSNNPGTQIEDLQFRFLKRGQVYFIRVNQGSGETRYNLSLGTFPLGIDTGSGEGVQQFRDLNLGQAGSNPTDFTAVTVDTQDLLFFAADNGSLGKELWVTDGTDQGTRRVSDINSGDASSDPTDLVSFNGFLYFSADDGVNGRELWRSDGTDAGTVRIFNSFGLNDGSSPRDLTVVGDSLFFVATDETRGDELFRLTIVNGVEKIVRFDINPGSDSSSPLELTDVEGVLYFSADRGRNQGRELFRFDPANPGIVQVDDINPGNESSNPSDFVAFNGTVYFAANAGTGLGTELYKLDPDTDQAVRVDDIASGSPSSSPKDLVVFNNSLFFSADADDGRGRELFQLTTNTQGLEVAQRVADINSGLDSSEPQDLYVFDDGLFFSATDGVRGRELFRLTFDSADNAQIDRIADINPGEADSSPADFEAFGDRLFFSADNGDDGREIFFYQPGTTA
jgi:ELWxxDGT repeat protein